MSWKKHAPMLPAGARAWPCASRTSTQDRGGAEMKKRRKGFSEKCFVQLQRIALAWSCNGAAGAASTVILQQNEILERLQPLFYSKMRFFGTDDRIVLVPRALSED
eukprot:1589301-Rhodomonas_salina.1